MLLAHYGVHGRRGPHRHSTRWSRTWITGPQGDRRAQRQDPLERTRQPHQENHFVVVTGIDTTAEVVHLNDSGIKAGRDEQVSLATFKQAWATSDNFAVVTA